MKRSPSPRAGRARAILPLALTSVVVLSVLTAPSAASAGWSARVTATGSVSAGSLAVAFGGALPLATFTNSSLSSTGSVSISNTTSSATAPPADLEVVFAGPSTPFAAATNLVVWPAVDASGCLAASTPGAGAVTGNWASGVTLAIEAVPRGATQIACVRTSVNARQDAATTTGYQSFAAGVQARLTLHAFSAQASSASAVGSALIFPFSTLGNFWYNIKPASDSTRCFDVTGGIGAVPGTVLGTYTCHTTYDPGLANQWFTLMPISGSLVAFRSSTSQNLFASASSTGAVTMQLRNVSDRAQSWEPQLQSPGLYQFVNDATGLCLSAVVGASGPTSVRECDGSAGQSFAATQLPVAPPS
jgi:hypothetical protein